MVQLKKKLSEKMKVKLISPVSGPGEMPEPDICVITSGGLRIPAHSKILASASPVLENIIERRQNNRKIRILGVPYNAVSVFLQFLYSSNDDEIEKYGIHLLALSHVYSVQQLKRRCSSGLGKILTLESVVDMLQLARLCDAPDLYLRCMKMMSNNDLMRAIEQTEGWKFLQNNDPHLELEILQFIDQSESMKKRAKRHRQQQSVYKQLSEAMDCLEHICSEGCTNVGPYDMDPNKHKGPCSKFSTCQGIQLLIKHFGTCKKRVNGGCLRCKRMWQLFRLHSSICDHPDECRVPLCRQFKLKAQQDRRGGDDAQWRLLVRKVALAKAMSTLSASKTKIQEGIRCFNLQKLRFIN